MHTVTAIMFVQHGELTEQFLIYRLVSPDNGLLRLEGQISLSALNHPVGYEGYKVSGERDGACVGWNLGPVGNATHCISPKS